MVQDFIVQWTGDFSEQTTLRNGVQVLSGMIGFQFGEKKVDSINRKLNCIS
jgi:hypothetical protein